VAAPTVVSRDHFFPGDSLSAAPGSAMPPASGRPARTQRVSNSHGRLLVLIVTVCNSGVLSAAMPLS
jgi:hypothetical protein